MKSQKWIVRNLAAVGAAFMLTTTTVGLIGCAGDRYRESTGEAIDDTAITARVKSALDDDSMTKTQSIKVQTFKGEVQLSGFVDRREQSRRAEEIAEKTAGVKSVKNSLIVK